LLSGLGQARGGAVSAVVPLADAQLITHRELSYAIAKTIAETAIDSCKANGYSVSPSSSTAPAMRVAGLHRAQFSYFDRCLRPAVCR
jgi:hypothetical protein